jgi:hypothetical protein
MDPTQKAVAYRKAAARCRKTAASSSSPKEWIAMAEQWELLANTEDGCRLLPSENSYDRSERSPDRTSLGSSAQITPCVSCP